MNFEPKGQDMICNMYISKRNQTVSGHRRDAKHGVLTYNRWWLFSWSPTIAPLLTLRYAGVAMVEEFMYNKHVLIVYDDLSKQAGLPWTRRPPGRKPENRGMSSNPLTSLGVQPKLRWSCGLLPCQSSKCKPEISQLYRNKRYLNHRWTNLSVAKLV